MISVFAAAILSTVTLDGSATTEGGDYAIETFEVPAGAVEITISRTVAEASNILDFGVFSPDGFRGWGGGLTEDAVIGIAESSRGYLPGPLTAGTWQVVVGKAKLTVVPADYQIVVTIRDDATLPVRDRADPSAAAIESGARWYAGDLHVHSRESGDASATYDEIAALANQRNLDFVVLSDHNTISGHQLAAAVQATLAGGPLLIRGNEVTTYGGHGNALGADAVIDHRVGFDGRTINDVIGDVLAASGHFIINHPTLELGGACIGCAWAATDTPWEQITGIEIHTGPFDLGDLFGGPARDMWDAALDDGHRVTAVGGSDDHKAGIDLGANQSPIGSPTTLVFADELSEPAILAGIAAGRVVVLLSGPDDPRVSLEVESDSGEKGAIGDTLAGDAVTIRALVSGASSTATAVLFESGTAGETLPIGGDEVTLEWKVRVPESGARYRVHVIDQGQLRTVTNHVYLDYAEGSAGGCGCQSGGGAGGGAAVIAMLLFAFSRRRRPTAPTRSRSTR